MVNELLCINLILTVVEDSGKLIVKNIHDFFHHYVWKLPKMSHFKKTKLSKQSLKLKYLNFGTKIISIRHFVEIFNHCDFFFFSCSIS